MAVERGAIERTAAALRRAQNRFLALTAQSRRTKEIGEIASAAKLDGGIGNWIPTLITSRGK